MPKTSFNLIWPGIACVLFLAFLVFARYHRPSSTASEQDAIRTLISRWVEAYQDFDAKRLAALETPDVEIVAVVSAPYLLGSENRILVQFTNYRLFLVQSKQLCRWCCL